MLHLTWDEVPHSVAVLIEEMADRQEKAPFYIRATVLVERESQKGIIIGQGGRQLKAIGPVSYTHLILTEGGITRLMPVFLHQDAPLLGSVRSARHYFLDKALEFNAAYSHCGYSPQAKQDISSLKVISLNEFYLPQVYWRVRTKKEPHNVYTSTERLFAELERRGLLTAPSPVQFSFYDDNCQPLGPGAKKAALRFSPNYVVEYRWDEAAGGYARFVNGKPQQDEHSGQQLVAKNVLVQFVDGTKVLDAEGRLDMKLVGQGGGRMFQQGVTYELNWSKPVSYTHLMIIRPVPRRNECEPDRKRF